jgi:hypothetical protein
MKGLNFDSSFGLITVKKYLHDYPTDPVYLIFGGIVIYRTVRKGLFHLCSGVQYMLPTLTVLTFANQTNQTYIDLMQYDIQALTCIWQVPTIFLGHNKAKSPLLRDRVAVKRCICIHNYFFAGVIFCTICAVHICN